MTPAVSVHRRLECRYTRSSTIDPWRTGGLKLWPRGNVFVFHDFVGNLTRKNLQFLSRFGQFLTQIFCFIDFIDFFFSKLSNKLDTKGIVLKQRQTFFITFFVTKTPKVFPFICDPLGLMCVNNSQSSANVSFIPVSA